MAKLTTRAVLLGENPEVPGSIRKVYDNQLLRRLTKTFIWSKGAQKKSYSKKGGDTIEFIRYNNLTAPDGTLTDGVTPEGSQLTTTKIEAKVEQYGDFVTITDTVLLTEVDSVVVEAVDILGEQAGETLDNKCRDALCSGTNVMYAGGRATRADIVAGDKITSGDIKKGAKILKKANIKPIDGYYYCKIDSDTAFDISSDPLWEDVSKYNGGKNIIEGELGKMHGVRFIETNNALTHTVDKGSGKTLDVHCCVLHGANALGIFDITGKKGRPEIIVKPRGAGDDPLNQRSTVGWTSKFVAKRINELGIVRIECAVTE